MERKEEDEQLSIAYLFTFIYVQNYSIINNLLYFSKASETDVGCQCQDVPYHPWMCLQLFVSSFPSCSFAFY